MAVTNVVDLLNTVRSVSSSEYQKNVPVATRENLASVLSNTFSDITTSNEFFVNFVNKVAISMVKADMFKNPFRAIFGSNTIPNLGNGVEEMYINPATDIGFDTDGTKLLKQFSPDGKVAYYARNRQARIPVSINRAQIMQCSTSPTALLDLCNGLIKSMYSGDEIAEFQMCLNLLASAVQNGVMRTIAVGDLEADGVAKKLAKTMQNVNEYMAFPDTQYNMYNIANEVGYEDGDEKPCVTWSNAKDRILIIRADVKNEINFEVLATLYNMSVAELKAQTMVVPYFPTEENENYGAFDVYAIMCDRSALRLNDSLYEVADFDNASTLTLNTYLHHWEYIYLSMFSNCVAFVKEDTTKASE